MEPPNAFAGQAAEPAEAELAAALGGAKPAWDQLLACLADDFGATVRQWRSYSVKSGWALRVQRGSRTIVWLAACPGCFRASFIMGAAALEAAHARGLSRAGQDALNRAVKYPEGTGVRLLIKSARDLGAVRKLAAAKVKG